MKNFLFLFLHRFPLLLNAQADTTQTVDTTSQGYRIGYQIGNWLPFLILFTLMILVIIRSARHNAGGKKY